ncbi:uncharacterized protein PHACADRAFT_149824 [Phanerochaete carnosa HHB-10118-sp]|uniref:laccase n=1 Tax=Phanerochaete carnosa (strain HHB-10118-sp) TaxID=650164 RepID=K5W1Y8_PHACS|nr:uncharacterized protein PHACADRAFT_149824 [Phanerochaete carnosa HHB-10118-sp]EKM52894.1 hypothetical protein PHACADRAFT_149824 [Phanerochaete carnosa HHB-10118-sp]
MAVNRSWSAESCQVDCPHRALNMYPAAFYLPLTLAFVVSSLVARAETRGLPHYLASSALSRRGGTVSVPSIDNFVVGSIIGEPPRTRYFDFVVSQMDGAPDGFTKSMLVVNGLYPGPTIEANQGDRIVVNVTNYLSTRTTIHWHGLYQNGTNYYDGTASVTECGIPPGEFLTYNFSVADFSGTTWWQTFHIDDTQYTDGATGAFIVHPSSYPSNFPTWDEDIVVELTDVYHTFSSDIASAYLTGKGNKLQGLALEIPDSGAINGVGQYDSSKKHHDFNLQPNKTYRLRLIHTGSATEISFSIDYHALTVIEADSTLTEPYTVSNLTLSVAQRYSVLITTDQTAEPQGNYWIRAGLDSVIKVPGTNTEVRGVVRYGSSTKNPTTAADPGVPNFDLSALDVSKLAPAVVLTPPTATRFHTLSFSINVTSSNGTISFINGVSWQPLVSTSTLMQVVGAAKNGSFYAPAGHSVQLHNQYIITEDSIEVVDLLLVNEGPGDHSFHLHGHTPYIMGSGTGKYNGTGLNTVNPITRDTYIVPSSGWLLVRFVTDNPGIWTVHCHIAWHMAAGLLMQFNSLPSKSAEFDIPQDILRQCSV